MRCQILIVDDDWCIRETFKNILEFDGYPVHTAENGSEALELLGQLDDLPHLILLDLMMPIMTGIQFLDAKRQDPRIAGIPVIVMSAAVNQPIPDEVMEVLKKPV